MKAGVDRVAGVVRTIIDVKYPGFGGEPDGGFLDCPEQISAVPVEVPDEVRILKMIIDDLGRIIRES